jgi:FkbM family methyltransferase
VDVGAHDPFVDSVSLAFYQRGWTGIHVEPQPEFAAKLKRFRPDEKVIEAAVSNRRGPLTLYQVQDRPGWATASADAAAMHASTGLSLFELQVKTVSLSDVLALIPDGDIHWLKIDVEGMEEDVIRSWKSSNRRPWIVVVEGTKPNSIEPSHESWEPIVYGLGYKLCYSDGLNRFFISDLHQELKAAFSSPPNVFDNFRVVSATRPFEVSVGVRDINVIVDNLETFGLAQARDIAETQRLVSSSRDEILTATKELGRLFEISRVVQSELQFAKRNHENSHRECQQLKDTLLAAQGLAVAREEENRNLTMKLGKIEEVARALASDLTRTKLQASEAQQNYERSLDLFRLARRRPIRNLRKYILWKVGRTVTGMAKFLPASVAKRVAQLTATHAPPEWAKTSQTKALPSVADFPRALWDRRARKHLTSRWILMAGGNFISARARGRFQRRLMKNATVSAPLMAISQMPTEQAPPAVRAAVDLRQEEAVSEREANIIGQLRVSRGL